jgi:predicted RNA-binding Zn-ribbon protein involved in translation (DUF1610 family)
VSLSCYCGDNFDWWYEIPEDFSAMPAFKRRRRCASCRKLIDPGSTVSKFRCWRAPNNDIEDDIYGTEIPLAERYLCERCGDLFFSLHELGYCLDISDNMAELVAQYAEINRELRSRE